MEKVIAVVVTYNRQELLAECITALRNQTRRIDKILVINNGSTDNTQGWLSSQHDIEFFTQKNIGSGGGFNKGIELAYEKEYDWIWLMDDDGFPKSDALENLLEDNAGMKLCLRNCAVINKEDKNSFVWKTGNYKGIDEVKEPIIYNFAHPFNGTLLHNEIIKKVGLPKKELFIWGDETEYYHRIITKYKIPFYTKANSIHYHPASAYSYKNDWDYNSNWKMYYYVRNRFHILKTKFSNNSFIALMVYLGFLISFSGIIMIFQKTNKFKKLSFILWPMKDAFTNNCEATPAIILQRLASSGKFNLIHYFQFRLKLIKGSVSHPSSPTLAKLKEAA
ncbi:MAG TPA: glycosyltransferase family 2 protein [Hanamia sp.]|nr:glycosyltransferase family 2 protein [Hanamia sp.]